MSYTSPNIKEIDHFRLGFGQKILGRMAAINEDVEIAGIPGLISLIGSLIETGMRTRDDILDHIGPVCPNELHDVAEELLDLFEGDDPRRHMWTEDGGYYQLIVAD